MHSMSAKRTVWRLNRKKRMPDLNFIFIENTFSKARMNPCQKKIPPLTNQFSAEE
jgi:hypothetical protein